MVVLYRLLWVATGLAGLLGLSLCFDQPVNIWVFIGASSKIDVTLATLQKISRMNGAPSHVCWKDNCMKVSDAEPIGL
jgi:hypothetical protein